MDKIFNFPYNVRAVARLDSNNIVHNHLYHNSPIGRVDNNIIYDNDNNAVGRVDDNGTVHNHYINNSPIGKVLENGFVSRDGILVGRVEGDNILLSGAAYLLL
ncbi:hypothetical protein, partial [Romboutsia sp. 13368]|uniref:hypothetical protein n=1 Tax=Romboutsia sp. 13368 TaxID=2708053 RepID=UPI0025F64E58